MDIQDLAYQLSQTQQNGYTFTTQLLEGEVTVLQVVVGQRDEFPVYISLADDQVLCITHLFKEDEVKPDQRNDMFEAMLEMNIPMPLSSFSKIDDRYVVFGALSRTSSFEDVVLEIVTLSDNSLDAIETLEPYLK